MDGEHLNKSESRLAPVRQNQVTSHMIMQMSVWCGRPFSPKDGALYSDIRSKTRRGMTEMSELNPQTFD